MDKKLVENYIFNVIYQILLLVTPFITTPYLTRVMGATPLGINASTQNIAQWFILFGMMGVNVYGNRKIASVRDNKEKLNKTFFEIYFMQLIFMCVAMVAFVFYINVIDKEYHNIYLIQMISLLSVSVDITWFFYGIENFKTASIRNCIVKILGIVLIFIFVKSPEDLPIFVLINASSGVLGQLIMWSQVRKYIRFTKVTLKGIFSHLKPNVALFIPTIAISVYSLLSTSMIRYLYPTDIRQVEFFEQAQRFVKMFLFFITSIGSVMLPRVANSHSKGDDEKVKKYLSKTFNFAIYLSIPLICGVAGVINYFVPWFMAEEFNVVGNMIIYLSPIILFISLSDVFGTQYLVPVGKTSKYTISVISGAVVDFIINIILIPKMGAYGAIIGTVVAELTVTVVQYIFIHKELKFDIKITQILIYLLSALCMYFVTYSIGKIMGARIITNIIQVVVGIVIYLLINLILREPFQKNIISTLIKKVKHVKD